jgi:hypothetical protein
MTKRILKRVRTLYNVHYVKLFQRYAQLIHMFRCIAATNRVNCGQLEQLSDFRLWVTQPRSPRHVAAHQAAS